SFVAGLGAATNDWRHIPSPVSVDAPAQGRARTIRVPESSKCIRALCSDPSTLITRSTRLRYPVQGPCRLWQRAVGRQIAQRDDADEAFLPIHHWQTPDLELRHILGHMIYLLILEAVFDFMAHDVADFSSRPFPLGHAANRDVAVGNHP